MTETNNATLEMNPTDVKPAESRMLSAVAHALELEQLGISQPPGLPEAAAIREDHATATAGMRAFVRMGFRLMDVKSRLPHGEYIPWCEKFLKGLSKPHLHRAKFIADHFSKCLTCETFDELTPEALQIIDGTGGIYSLMAAIQDFPEIIGSEADAKKSCEARWERHPEERDDWEPRVLSGEMNYHRALTGMLGSSATAGKPREPVRPFEILLNASWKMAKHFASFDGLPPLAQARVIEEFTEMAGTIPEAVRSAMLEVWKGGADVDK